MPYINAYGTRRAATVVGETWGHLAPQQDRVYAGTMTYTLGCFGDLAVIRVDFTDLPDSPWFYEDLHEWIWNQGPSEGTVYQFTGTYCRDRSLRFVGHLGSVTV